MQYVYASKPNTERVRFLNISNGKRSFLIDLACVPTAVNLLKKIFTKEERQKITYASHKMELYFCYSKIHMNNVIDIEMLGIAVEKNKSSKKLEYFRRETKYI